MMDRRVVIRDKQKVICHVCRKEKKPYVVFITDNIFSYLQHEQARPPKPMR